MICALHLIVFYTWTIVFYNMYINFHLYRFLCQKASSVFQDPSFSFCFCSTEPSLRLCDGSISKSLSWGFLKMVSGDNPLPIQGLQRCQFLSTLVSNSLSLTLGGMPEISRHSLLQYCLFAKLFRSTLISLSDSLELTFLDLFRQPLI